MQVLFLQSVQVYLTVSTFVKAPNLSFAFESEQKIFVLSLLKIHAAKSKTDRPTDPPSYPHTETHILWPDLVNAVSGGVHFNFFSLRPAHLLSFMSMAMHYWTGDSNV